MAQTSHEKSKRQDSHRPSISLVYKSASDFGPFHNLFRSDALLGAVIAWTP